MDKKKSLILSIVGVLVLIVVVVGISYAMYSFTGTGAKENVITTGSISITYTEQNNISLVNLYPESDARGLAHNGSCTDPTKLTKETCIEATETWHSAVLEFTVGATMSSPATITYEVGLDNISEGPTLKDENVKINVTKNGTELIGTVTTGVMISTLAGTTGTIPAGNPAIAGYRIASGTFTANGQTDTYVVRAWVDSEYNLPVPDANTVGENSQSLASTSESFSFKIKAYGEQTTGA